jgi:hypothetical protein
LVYALEAFSLQSDVDIHGYAKTVDFADMMYVADHFHNLWQHHDLLDNSFDDFILDLYCATAAFDFLHDGLSCDLYFAVLNRRAYFYFGVDFPDDF